MSKKFLTLGSVFACLAVLLGAFGAHTLKSKLSPEHLQSFETGVRYQFYHSLALIALFLLAERVSTRLLTYAGNFFMVGVVLFSGSIYLLSCREILGIEGWKFLGPVTPLGGLCFIAGWICLIIASTKKLNK